MLSRSIADPGIGSIGVGLISTKTIEYGTPVWALPARSCPVIVITKPIASAAHLAYTHRLVYSTFTLKIDQVLKGSRKQGIREENQIRAAEMGGTIRFPSGQIETFLWAREGFLRLGSEYLVFAWKPIKSDDTYLVAEAYLIENGTVYPIDLDAHESGYAGMPFKSFESKVKAAIAENKDTN